MLTIHPRYLTPFRAAGSRRRCHPLRLQFWILLAARAIFKTRQNQLVLGCPTSLKTCINSQKEDYKYTNLPATYLENRMFVSSIVFILLFINFSFVTNAQFFLEIILFQSIVIA